MLLHVLIDWKGVVFLRKTASFRLCTAQSPHPSKGSGAFAEPQGRQHAHETLPPLVWLLCISRGRGMSLQVQASMPSAGPNSGRPANLTGTTAFNSPEYARQDPDEHLDACAQDTWAVGVLAVILFGGFMPFEVTLLPDGEPDWQELSDQHNSWVRCLFTATAHSECLQITTVFCWILQRVAGCGQYAECIPIRQPISWLLHYVQDLTPASFVAP